VPNVPELSEPSESGELSEPPELIEVRPDERFETGRLGDYLKDRLPGAHGKPTVLQFAGGHANLTYLVSFGDTEYVLRRPPLGTLAPSSHDMAREYRVLSRLWRLFPPAPRAYLLCEDFTVVGSPFFVMERRHGVVVRNQVPQRFGGGKDLVANRRLSEVVIDTLVDLHAVDAAAAGLGELGRPEGFLERQIAGWIERWEKAKHEENPVADRVASELAASVPASRRVTLVHNDWRLDNMAVASDDPGRCEAVFDWDMCTRGDPLADLGTLLAVWYRQGEVPAALNPMPTNAPGFMSRDEAVARYGARSSTDLADVGWYLVFGTFKLGVILQQIYIRWLKGQTRDERFSVLGEAAARLFELAEERRG
jgi:aminoglycoside phosphotransferase (APT) family kinase protein